MIRLLREQTCDWFVDNRGKDILTIVINQYVLDQVNLRDFGDRGIEQGDIIYVKNRALALTDTWQEEQKCFANFEDARNELISFIVGEFNDIAAPILPCYIPPLPLKKSMESWVIQFFNDTADRWLDFLTEQEDTRLSLPFWVIASGFPRFEKGILPIINEWMNRAFTVIGSNCVQNEEEWRGLIDSSTRFFEEEAEAELQRRWGELLIQGEGYDFFRFPTVVVATVNMLFSVVATLGLGVLFKFVQLVLKARIVVITGLAVGAASPLAKAEEIMPDVEVLVSRLDKEWTDAIAGKAIEKIESHIESTGELPQDPVVVVDAVIEEMRDQIATSLEDGIVDIYCRRFPCDCEPENCDLTFSCQELERSIISQIEALNSSPPFGRTLDDVCVSARSAAESIQRGLSGRALDCREATLLLGDLYREIRRFCSNEAF